MKLTVTTRIAGGFTLVVLLALAISTAGLIGLGSIQKSLNEVTEVALPIKVEISHLESAVLTSQLNIKDYLRQTKSSDLASFETSYKNNLLSIQNHFQELQKLSSESPAIAKELKILDMPLSTIESEAETALRDYRESLVQGEAVARKKRLVTDGVDEILSLTGALRASNSELAGTIDDINKTLDTLVLNAISAQEKTIPAAVKAAEKRTKKELANLEKKLLSLGQSNDSALVKTFLELKNNLSGDNGLLGNRIKQLELDRNAKKEEALINETSIKLFASLKTTKDLITKNSDQASQHAEESVSSSRSWMISLSVIALILSTVISLSLTHNIRSRLNEVVDYIRIIGSGDLRNNINVSSEDELGILAAGTQDLVVKLRHILGEISKSSQQLAATAEETSSISSLGLNNIVQQKEQTDMIATAIAEMSATVNEVAQNVTLTLHSIESAYKQVTQGQTELEGNINNIRHLASGIDQSATVITRVSEYSANIGSILDVIRGIAEQTNLLALNAAIEAARAGEQGRGFAVVADEVRTLASRTQSSTTEIQDMIQRLQNGVEEAVNVMATSRDEATITVTKIAATGEMLTKISQAMNSIKDMSTQIASATEEQAAATQEQHRNVEAISQMAEQTASGARDSNQASHELARMAETMRGLISQFRI